MPESHNPYLGDYWRGGTECAKLPAKEADYLFFQENPNNPKRGLRAEPTRLAKDMCQKCPVLKQCLKDALNHPELAGYGVRGGKSARERQEILRLGKNAINKAIESAGK